jgi:hypothetical protein
MRALGLALWVIAVTCCVRGAASTSQEPSRQDGGALSEGKTTMSHDDAGAPDPIQMPKLLLEAAPRYLVGFPLVVAVTYDNRSNPVEFYRLPDLDLLFPTSASSGNIGLHLAPLAGGAPVDLGPRYPRRETEPGAQLGEGEQRRMALDLSNFGLSLQPGTYRLTLTLRSGKETTTSNPVTVELAAPTPDDAQEAARLRRLGAGARDNGSWAPFVSHNWNTVVLSPSLSFEAQRQLALHLFLHRAFYGPEPVGRIDDSLLQRIAEPSLAAEVAALRYEILAARGAPDAKQVLDDMLARWPGMRYRFAPREDRLGQPVPAPLAFGRRVFGAEKEHLRPPPFMPYTK